jgi:DNA primase
MVAVVYARGSGRGGGGVVMSAARRFSGNDDVERVREAADIVRVIGEHVALRPKGREYAGLCPFHDDHSPSMFVVPSKGIYKCFSCGAGGDVFTFTQNFLKMDFREAIEYLAERFSVTLTPFKPTHEPAGGGVGGSNAWAGSSSNEDGSSVSVSRADLFRANQVAAEFFRVILSHAEHGSAARSIVQRRAISPEMQTQFMLGAAPARWDGLLMTLRNKGLRENVFAEAGLLKRRDDGSGCYDSFRNRLIFPILDKAGRVVAFGGRKIDDQDEPKYLNSPESRVFRKSATLYGLTHASRAIQRERTALITEGYMDTIACHQAGFANAVATLGTALTPEHAVELRRICETVVLVFDGDAAGQRASDRAVEVFFAEPIDVRICALSAHSDAKDPDELLKREGGAEIFRKAVTHATDLLDYRFDRIRDRLRGSGMSALAKAIDEEIGRLVELGLADLPPVRQAMVVKRLASLARVEESVIRAAIPAGRGGRPGAFRSRERENVEPRTVLASGRFTVREHALGCVLCDGVLWMTMPEPLRRSLLTEHREPGIDAVASAISRVASRGEHPSLRRVLDEVVEDGDAARAAVNLAEHVETVTDRDADRLAAHWKDCVRRLEQDAIHRPGVGAGVRAGIESGGEPAAMDPERARTMEMKLNALRARGPDARVFPRHASGAGPG